MLDADGDDVGADLPNASSTDGYGFKTDVRKPGSINKTTASVKSAIRVAFERAGGVDYLVEVAKADPRIG